jgi:hypothetical protein
MSYLQALLQKPATEQESKVPTTSSSPSPSTVVVVSVAAASKSLHPPPRKPTNSAKVEKEKEENEKIDDNSTSASNATGVVATDVGVSNGDEDALTRLGGAQKHKRQGRFHTTRDGRARHEPRTGSGGFKPHLGNSKKGYCSYCFPFLFTRSYRIHDAKDTVRNATEAIVKK